VRLAIRFPPLGAAPGVEERIAVLDPGMHQRQMNSGDERDAFPVDLASPDHHQTRIPVRLAARGVEGRYHHAIRRREAFRAGQDDVGSAGQRPADRFVGLSAHQDRVTHGQRLEALQVRRQPPRQLIATADDVIFRHCDHDFHARKLKRIGGSAADGNFHNRSGAISPPARVEFEVVHERGDPERYVKRPRYDRYAPTAH